MQSIAWTGLDQTDDQGNLYTYTVKEVDASGADYTPAGYIKTEDGLTVTNTKTVTDTMQSMVFSRTC